MITLINDLPGNIAAFRFNGTVTHQDYVQVVIPRIDAVASETGQVRFFVLLETNLGNFDLRAVWDDIRIGLRHISVWHKTAIVSDERAARTLTDTAGQLVPGEVRSFKLDELAAAKAWIAA